MHLSKLMQMVQDAWKWNAQRYPGLPDERKSNAYVNDDDPRLRFQRKHIFLHMMHHVGRLAETEQECDHDPINGLSGPGAGRTEHVAKLLINILQLANVQEISVAELLAEIKRTLAASNESAI